MRAAAGLTGRLSGGFVLLAIYGSILGFTQFHHAMWLDEMQAWLIARDSRDIPDLFRHLHYEGHPALWYLLLTPLAQASRDPLWMQLLNGAIAVATVGVVVFRAPLSAVERCLFPFGYFVLFEYGVKSRSYALGCLLLVTLCALWPLRRRHPWLIALLVALLANVHVMFMIMSTGIVLALCIERLHAGNPAAAAGPTADAGAALIVVLGWITAAATAWPAADSGYMAQWIVELSGDRLERTFSTLGLAVGARPWLFLSVLGAAMLLCTVGRARRNPAVAGYLALSVLGLLIFFYTRVQGNVWHCGLIFMAFFTAIWLDRISRPASIGVPSRPLVPALTMAALLAVQAVVGASAVWGDLARPMSSGRDVARYLSSQGWAGDPIIGTVDKSITSIVGYLQIDHAYFANGRRLGSFVVWDQQRLQPTDLRAALQDTMDFGPAATLIAPTSAPLPTGLAHEFGFHEVALFDRAVFGNENYTIYRRTELPARSD